METANSLIPMGERAKAASRVLALTSDQERADALNAMADALEAASAVIVEANGVDMENGRANGLSTALLDRLMLDEARVRGIAGGMREVASLPDPVGRVLEDTVRPNGLRLEKVTVPMGVIAVIFEARPNVSADSAALCLRAGSAVILRGGKEAIESNKAIIGIMRGALASCGIPEDCIQLVEDTTRQSSTDLMTLDGYVDVLIPRGGAGLIKAVTSQATVPTIETGAGTCHTYVDAAADIPMAADIVFNAKTSRPSVCNACECLLVHEAIAAEALPVIAARLAEKNVEIHGDELSCAILRSAGYEGTVVAATDDDWGREYGDYIIACKVVAGVGEAIEHITRYGTRHSECIVTADEAAAKRFLDEIDASSVYWNASTRFTDGGEFGLGAEIGISTQKLHARGPLGLRELCSYKYRIYGDGQVR